ncbi:hypothetical protein [Arthrobacter mangrovi]|uniref:Uncharacterized protein n=1 Tax=Arthrobacter mangrovi TaxID=2966350 RepID=A0ABQ5MQ46_9MICC|nr:hypothetical protein [Arthrobacter mangrovi]GLB65830.1 hypothetical protein AHIS1636_02690 [Arthrobacter mangrovi]
MNHAVSHNDDDVRHLLEDAGLEQTSPLEASLMALRAAGHEPMQTAPSPELLAFMGPAADPSCEPSAEPSATPSPVAPVVPLRRRRTMRGAALGLAVVAATGLGVSGVAAASPGFRAAAGTAVEQVVGFFDPSEAGRQAVPSTEANPGDADAPEQPAFGTSGNRTDSGPAGHGTAGAGGESEDNAGGSRSAGETGRDVSGSGSGRSDSQPAPAPQPERAGNGALQDPGSIPAEAGDTAKKLVEDAGGTQPSDVVPSLPADDVLPAPGKPDSGVKDLPAPPKDAPAPSQ